MRAPALVVTAITLAALSAGCAPSGGGPPGGSPATGATGSSGAARATRGAMTMDMGDGAGPSAPAAMICGEEVRGDVRRIFGIAGKPSSRSTWSTPDRVYDCRWALPGGTLELSVQDARGPAEGRAYFDDLRARLPGARTLRGMASLGFPAFDTEAGDAVFLKDGKTLRVDASRLPPSALPAGYSRADAAYAVASAVIACWSE